MLRHVALFTLKEESDPAALARALAAIRRAVPGVLSASWGPDAGLRPGNAGFTSVWEFEDDDAYRAWDTHPEHERIRREQILPQVAGVLRGQYRIP
jgi:hypothetical protein